MQTEQPEGEAGAPRQGWRPRLERWARTPSPANTAVAAGLFLLLVVVVVDLVRQAWSFPPYQPDSWSYLELARTALSDPGRISTFRSYVSTQPYTASFPLGWPVVIAVLQLVTRTDTRAPLVGTALTVLATAVVLDVAGRRLFGWRGLGPAAVLLLLVFPGFAQEVVAGGSLPLAMLLVAGVVAVASGPWPLSDRAAAGVGVLGGLLVLTRFDALGLVALVPLALLAVRAVRRRGLLVAYAATAVTLLPWVLYSLVHFRKPFITDNASVATAVKPLFVLDYPLPDQPTVLRDPGGWFARIRDNLGDLLPHQVDTFASGFVIKPLLLAVVGVVVWACVAGWHAPAAEGGGDLRAATGRVLRQVGGSRPVRLFAALAVAAAVALAVAQTTTGYFQPRYSSALLLLVYLLGFAVVVAAAEGLRAPARPVLVGAAVAAVVVLGVIPLFQARKSLTLVPYVYLVGQNVAPDAARLGACVGPDDRVLFMDSRDGGSYALGALSGRQAAIAPTNWGKLTPEQRTQIVADHGVTMVVLPDMAPAKRGPAARALARSFAPPLTLVDACVPGAYRIVPAR